jgi:hypothetical protein
MVLIRGIAKVGKKRSAYEVLKECCGGRPVVVPVRPSPAEKGPLRRLADLGLPVGPRSEGAPVLWLENAEWWSEAGDLDLLVLQQLRERHPGLLVVATLRYGAVVDADALASAGEHELSRGARGHEQVWIDIRAQPWVVEHEVATQPSPTELSAARASYPEYEERADLATSIGRFFAGSDQLLRKLAEGRGGQPLGVALVEAVVGCRRSGLDEPIAAEVVKAVAAQQTQVVDASDGLDEDSLAEAVDWALRPVESGARLLSRSGSDRDVGLSVSDDVYDHLAVEPGRPARELETVRQVAAVVNDLCGPDHPDTLTTRNNVAFWTGEAGDAREALRLSVVLLPNRERVLGPDHPDTLTTRHNVAVWTGQVGDAREALRLFGELLPDRKRVLGPDHPDTLAARGNVAGCDRAGGGCA